MAPTSVLRDSPSENARHISRSLSALVPSLRSRGVDLAGSTTPAPSIFAILNHAAMRSTSLSARAITSLLKATRHPIPSSPSSGSIAKRQNILAIPTGYAGLNSGPTPGAVVGIVLGSVFGFLLILWLIYTIVSATGGSFGRRETIVEEEIIRRRSHSPSRRSRRSEMTEVIASPPPPRRRESRRAAETVVVEEEHISRSRAPSAPPPESVEREEDIVEVIEEHSPPPPARRESKRESKRMSGFRTVDPAEFGGGGRRMRRVRD